MLLSLTSSAWSLSSDGVVWALLASGLRISAFVAVIAHACTHIKLNRKRSRTRSTVGISVMRPIKGVDDRLAENLQTLLEQDHDGPVEVIVVAADPHDPGLEAVREVQRCNPGADLKVIAGHRYRALNNKVANLMAATDAAKHDVLVVSDSNVTAEPGYLSEISREIEDPRVGVVTNLVVGIGERGLGAGMENMHLGGFITTSICVAEIVENPCVIGKSMMVRRDALAAVGGWESVSRVLGEDYLLGKSFAQSGYRVVTSEHVVRTVNETWSMRHFMSRHLRWSQMRRWIAPRLFILEPLVNPVPWAFAMWLWAGDQAMQAALTVIIGKMMLDAVVCRRLRGTWPSLLAVASIPLKDVIALLLWGMSWMRRSVSWRGSRFRIGPGSRLEPWGKSDEPELIELDPLEEPEPVMMLERASAEGYEAKA